MKRIGTTSSGSVIVEITEEDYSKLLPEHDTEILYDWERDFKNKLKLLDIPTRVRGPLNYASNIKTTKSSRVSRDKWITVDCPPYIQNEELFKIGQRLLYFDQWIEVVAAGEIYPHYLLHLRNFGDIARSQLKEAAKKYVAKTSEASNK